MNLVMIFPMKMTMQMRTTIRTSLLVWALLIFASTTWAQSYPEAQNPQRLVNDFADILSSDQENALEARLVAFDDSTSTQIAVVTVADLEGADASEYATELAHRWGIGQAGKDNGVLILVKPKTAESRGEYHIAVGYGLEGAIPDVYASRIGREIMIPAFAQNNYFAGINDATRAIMQMTTGEYTAEESGEQKRKVKMWTYIIIGMVFLFIFFGSNRKNKNGGGGNGGSHRDDDGDELLSALGWGLFGASLGSRSGGGFGSSGGSGFGGGGFGGFGGGGFGGGGAGGSW